MKIFNYKAYSFEITSTFEIPELLPIIGIGNTDVLISYSKVQETLENPIFSNEIFQVCPNKFLLNIDQVARYLIENGNSIIIEPYEGVTDAEVRLYLLGSAFGALMHQRGLLPVHGSAIIYNNQALLFSGVNGIGKSTLAAGFIQKGFKLLADDICVITLDKLSKPIVHPAYPQMKLWTDSIRKLNHDINKTITKHSKPKKYSLPFHMEFSASPMKLTGIYIITKKAVDQFKIHELFGSEKLNRLKNNIYRNNFLIGMPSNIPLNLMQTIGEQCFVKIVERPVTGFNLEKLIQLIETDVSAMEAFNP